MNYTFVTDTLMVVNKISNNIIAHKKKQLDISINTIGNTYMYSDIAPTAPHPYVFDYPFIKNTVIRNFYTNVTNNLTNAFKFLFTHITEEINNWNDLDTNGDSKIPVEVQQWVDGVCKNTPLILFYIDYFDVQNTDTLFGYYYTLCYDWEEFLQYQCPTKFKYPSMIEVDNEKINVVECIRQSMMEHLMHNIQSIPNSNTELQYKCDSFTSCIEYVSKINSDIQTYYIETTPVFVWTQIKWMSGKVFLNENIKIKSKYFQKTINKLMSVNSEQMPLSDVYSRILPWMTNSQNVFQLHAITLYYIDRTLIEFVVAQTLIIARFLKTMNDIINDSIETRLFLSFMWYEKFTEMFYKYINSSRKYNPWNSLNEIFTSISKSDHNKLNGAIQEVYPDLDIQNFLTLDIFADALYNNVPNVSDMAYAVIQICYEAIIYINDFLEIVRINFNVSDTIIKFNCIESLSDIFS